MPLIVLGLACACEFVDNFVCLRLRSAGFEFSWPLKGYLFSVVFDQQSKGFALRINGLPFQLFYRREGLGFRV